MGESSFNIHNHSGGAIKFTQNVLNNGMLVLPVSKEATIIGFADDFSSVVIVKHREDIVVYVTEILSVFGLSWKGLG